MRADGRYVTSSTVVGESFALRPCYINPRTTMTEVDRMVDTVIEIGRRLTGNEGSHSR